MFESTRQLNIKDRFAIIGPAYGRISELSELVKGLLENGVKEFIFLGLTGKEETNGLTISFVKALMNQDEYKVHLVIGKDDKKYTDAYKIFGNPEGYPRLYHEQVQLIMDNACTCVVINNQVSASIYRPNLSHTKIMQFIADAPVSVKNVMAGLYIDTDCGINSGGSLIGYILDIIDGKTSIIDMLEVKSAS